MVFTNIFKYLNVPLKNGQTFLKISKFTFNIIYYMKKDPSLRHTLHVPLPEDQSPNTLGRNESKRIERKFLLNPNT